MTRMLAFVAALLLSAIAVSSACVANAVEPLHFTIEPSRHADRIQVSFKRADQKNTNSWSSGFRPAELAGLDLAGLRSPGTRPIRFAIVRDAGRVSCTGTGGNAMARGSCTLTADPGFNDFLAANGIARPGVDQTFGLIALDVRRDLVTALSQARYPTPTVEKLMELSAVGVTPGYIAELARQDYRPKTLQDLVEFGALEITPEFIGSFVRAGYGNLGADELVQLKAMNITPAYVAGFERLGYRNIPVSELVQLKALDVTPEFVRSVQQGGTLPSPDRLVQLRAVTMDRSTH